MKKFIEENWLFLLFVIPFALICINNKQPDNDIWVILNNGKYILSNGIPYIEPFTMHEGLSFVMQQWLTSLIFWSIFSVFKKYGLIVMIHIVSLVLMFTYYKLLKMVSHNKPLSIILTTIAFSLMPDFIVTRPQIFTILILLVELIVLENYFENNENKYLFILPLLSFIMINLHAAMWFFQFIFLLPYMIEVLKNKINKKSIKLKTVIITVITMFIAGLINPYGVKAITYIFKSYGNSFMNELIKELNPLNVSDIHGMIILGLILLMIFIINFQKKSKLSLKYFLFICGVIVLGFMHLKGYPYFILIYFFALAFILKDIKKVSKDNKYIKALCAGGRTGLIAMLPLTFILTIFYSITNYSFENSAISDIGEYVLTNYKVENIKLYVDLNYGGYAEYIGMKSFIDPRVEVFFKKFNGKKDILLEYYALKNNRDFNFKDFLESYNFTHIIVDINSTFDDYLSSREDYEVVFTQSSGYYKLYALKSLEN